MAKFPDDFVVVTWPPEAGKIGIRHPHKPGWQTTTIEIAGGACIQMTQEMFRPLTLYDKLRLAD